MDKINEVLLENNERLIAQNEVLTEQVKQLNEQIAYMSRKLFGTSSEKTPTKVNSLFLKIQRFSRIGANRSRNRRGNYLST